MELISRKSALELGLKRYFTGMSCRDNHVAERYSSDCRCVECGKKKFNAWRSVNADVNRARTDAWCKHNPEQVAAMERRRRAKFAGKIDERARTWAINNPEARRIHSLRWAKDNPEKSAAATARRRSAKEFRTPSWASAEKIAWFYAEAKRLEAETGTPHHVDHIVPLRGKTVSGLHCEANLQVLTASENVRKSNRFHP